MSGDPKQDYFADGITEQIITELSRFRNLFVISRNSTFKYKGQAVDVRQVGRELGAKYVLEGSVRRETNTARVTAQLLDARTGAHLWAESYDRDLGSAKSFSVQDDITERVVGAIGDAYGVISRVTFEQSKGKGTASLDAYECVLHTYAFYRSFMVSEHAKVRDCLEQAVNLDPNYAEAWAQLAQIYVEEHAFGFNPRPNSLDRAVKAAQRAVELDSTSQPAHTHLAAAYFFRHDLDAFSAEAERAVALNSNNADVLAWVGVYTAYANMSNVAKRERGIAMIRKAIALSPFHPDWYYQPITWNHYWKGEYEQALIQSQKVNVPGDHWTWVLRATLYGALGRKAEAQPAIVNLLKLYPEFPNKIRENMRKWNTPDDIIDRVINDLRRAGLNVPPQ